MNTQLRIAFVLAFSVIGGAALAEDGVSDQDSFWSGGGADRGPPGFGSGHALSIFGYRLR